MEPSVAAALVAAGALVLAVGLAALREQRRTLQAGDWARHARPVLEQIAIVLQRVTDAETGQRGYLMTGDATYLEPYDRAVAALPKALRRLRTMTADNPVQQPRLDGIERLDRGEARGAAAHAGAARRAVTRRASRTRSARASASKYMDRIREQLAAAAKMERDLLRERLRRARRNARRTPPG